LVDRFAQVEGEIRFAGFSGGQGRGGHAELTLAPPGGFELKKV
jgi:hypothetical protein